MQDKLWRTLLPIVKHWASAQSSSSGTVWEVASSITASRSSIRSAQSTWCRYAYLSRQLRVPTPRCSLGKKNRVLKCCPRHYYSDNILFQHAVLLGTPASPTGEGWQRARQVVSGRLINGYIKSDWVLGFLYRY